MENQLRSLDQQEKPSPLMHLVEELVGDAFNGGVWELFEAYINPSFVREEGNLEISKLSLFVGFYLYITLVFFWNRSVVCFEYFINLSNSVVLSLYPFRGCSIQLLRFWIVVRPYPFSRFSLGILLTESLWAWSHFISFYLDVFYHFRIIWHQSFGFYGR